MLAIILDPPMIATIAEATVRNLWIHYLCLELLVVGGKERELLVVRGKELELPPNVGRLVSTLVVRLESTEKAVTDDLHSTQGRYPRSKCAASLLKLVVIAM